MHMHLYYANFIGSNVTLKYQVDLITAYIFRLENVLFKKRQSIRIK